MIRASDFRCSIAIIDKNWEQLCVPIAGVSNGVPEWFDGDPFQEQISVYYTLGPVDGVQAPYTLSLVEVMYLKNKCISVVQCKTSL